MERLSDRDWVVLKDVNRLRLMGSGQIERLHFADVAEAARGRTRRRSLARLVEWRVLTTLERRIGGVRAGSAGLVYALDSGGERVLRMVSDNHSLAVPDGCSPSAADDRLPVTSGEGDGDDDAGGKSEGENSGNGGGAEVHSDGAGDDDDRNGTSRKHRPRSIRRPGAPTGLFVRHTLAVSELYVQLVEAVRRKPGVRLAAFEAEPGSWWPDGLGGMLKPDAYVALGYGEIVDHWWVEVDRATESLPVIRRKLRAYGDFANRGMVGPGGVVPRVVVTVPGEERLGAVWAEVERLPHPGRELVGVVEHRETVNYLLSVTLSADVG